MNADGPSAEAQYAPVPEVDGIRDEPDVDDRTRTQQRAGESRGRRRTDQRGRQKHNCDSGQQMMVRGNEQRADQQHEGQQRQCAQRAYRPCRRPAEEQRARRKLPEAHRHQEVRGLRIAPSEICASRARRERQHSHQKQEKSVAALATSKPAEPEDEREKQIELLFDAERPSLREEVQVARQRKIIEVLQIEIDVRHAEQSGDAGVERLFHMRNQQPAEHARREHADDQSRRQSPHAPREKAR